MPARSYNRIKSAAALFLVLLLSCFTVVQAKAVDGHTNTRLLLAPYLEGLDAPIFMTYDSDGRFYVVERAGRIRIVVDGEVRDEPLLDIQDRVATYRECGLLSMALAPDFATRRTFYVYYSYDVQRLGDLVGPAVEGEPSDGCDSVVARFKVDADELTVDRETEERILLVNQPYSNHNGGQITFGPDGYLYVALGDGGSGGDPHDLAQNGNSLLGKMLRVNVTESGPYTIPADNPFVGNSGYRDEIWALGLRNPWRFSFDRETSDLFIGDVGQGLYEEVNFQATASSGGENYGWNLLEGNHCYEADPPCQIAGMTAPILEYGRSMGSSITGGYRYRGSDNPALVGTYLYADYGSANIFGAVESNGAWASETLLANSHAERIVSLAEDAVGELYVIDLDGIIYQIIDLANLSQRQYLPMLVND